VIQNSRLQWKSYWQWSLTDWPGSS